MFLLSNPFRVYFYCHRPTEMVEKTSRSYVEEKLIQCARPSLSPSRSRSRSRSRDRSLEESAASRSSSPAKSFVNSFTDIQG